MCVGDQQRDQYDKKCRQNDDKPVSDVPKCIFFLFLHRKNPFAAVFFSCILPYDLFLYGLSLYVRELSDRFYVNHSTLP